MTSKKIVINTLKGSNTGRVPRELWTLPWAEIHYPGEIKRIQTVFPDDFEATWAPVKDAGIAKGNPYEIGTSTDNWGCEFINVNPGVHGEVKKPLVVGDDWEDEHKVHIPEEFIDFDIQIANDNIKPVADKYIKGGICPRPFEQLQFIRGTENLMMDLIYKPKGFLKFLEKMHDFYCRACKKWVQTDIDAISFMDDWGSQRSLLISPKLWNEIFRPLYRDYIDIARKAGKKTFFHTDGYVLDIIPRMIDLGLDVINCQLFCMEMDKLKQYKGKITFWGEIDRQHLLARGTKQDIIKAVRLVYDNLYSNGYCIAQCSFDAGSKPENVYTVFETWDKLTS